MFWLEIDDDYGCPAFQVGPSGLLPGIRKVLEGITTIEEVFNVAKRTE